MNDFIKGDTLLIKDLTDEINRLRQDHSKLLDELNTAVMKLANKEQEQLDTLNDNKYYKNLCLELTQQLAEKKKKETKRMEDFEKGCQEYYKSNQTAIAELEKVKETFKKDCQQYSQFIILHDMFLIDIDQQIKSLKGEK